MSDIRIHGTRSTTFFSPDLPLNQQLSPDVKVSEFWQYEGMCSVGSVVYDACPLARACTNKRCETYGLTKRRLGEEGIGWGEVGR